MSISVAVIGGQLIMHN